MRVDAVLPEFAHGLARVFDQGALVGRVDVAGLAVGEDEQQLLVGLARAQVVARVAQGRAHAGGIARLDARQAALHVLIKTFVKTLDVLVAHVVPGVGMKARDGEGIAQLLDRPGQQGDGFAAQVEHGLFTACRGFVE
ncbi:hypothetical protein D9M69_537450 [compost metagenome]